MCPIDLEFITQVFLAMETLPKTNPLTVLADIAHTQIGVHELGDSNSGPQVQLYQSATSEPGTGWPWCAAFVCWCVAKLAETRPGLLSCEVHQCLPKEASVEGLIDWALRTGQLVFTPSSATYSPQAGDVVCMKFPTGRHCGIATGGFAGNCIPTIEGNTSGPYRANPDERNGGEVAAKSRLVPNVTNFIRLTLQATPIHQN
jgi:hypothetical protein